jgi:hypothetical protein
MKVYLAGRIHGTDDYHERFAVGADELRSQGHSVYNPAASNQEGRPLAKIMAHLLPQLCECEAIALLPDWTESDGAQVELFLAEYIGLKVIEL